MSESLFGGVRNPEGIWINTATFREEANNFKKYGTYCSDPWGSPDWFSYWREQKRRCIYGYSSGGARITGDHYFYLNFCPIQQAEDKTKKKSKKVKDFPDFWDGDYNYFWAREIARNGVLDSGLVGKEESEEIFRLKFGTKEEAEKHKQELLKIFAGLCLEIKIEPNFLLGGYNLIVGKSRRKGYSYKNASIAAKNYLHIPGSLTIFGAYEKKYLYPKGIFSMTLDYLNFINDNTPWIMPRDVIDRQDHIRASYIEYKNGVKIEKGYKSEVMALTFKDNPDAARGKDAYDLIFEEAGAFGTPGLLKDSYFASEDCVKAGDIKTGMITIFGTSGDMEGGTADYADMHSRPETYDMLSFQNIWDEDSENMKCGFFHPITWNMEGFYDEHGNSDIAAATQAVKLERKRFVDNGLTSSEIQRKIQEKPFGPFEAFGMVSTNNFPVLELKRRLEIVKANNYHLTKGTPVDMYYDYSQGKVVVKPILDGSANVIYNYKPNNLSLEGCPVIYEYPAEKPVPGAYKIGYDPYRQQLGTSLAAIYVYKPVIIGHHTKKIIVAEYVGRPEEADDVNKIAGIFAMLYNTTIMHENEVTHVKDYFRRRKQLHLLAYQPDQVISKHVKNSKVARIYGCHMIEQLKDAGEKYIKSWLTEVLDYDEHGKAVTTIDFINSVGLLEELIAYNRKGNFDRVMALMQALFQDQEDLADKTYQAKATPNKSVQKLLEMRKKMHGRNNSRGFALA